MAKPCLPTTCRVHENPLCKETENEISEIYLRAKRCLPTTCRVDENPLCKETKIEISEIYLIGK